ncbi:CYP27A1 [Symbiodinium pilosum]|uniref:CYP27A1 protein n=1 Tax=Symbiodinium pilosum TaxID=2952 RepID=A0A812MIQ6_SYMPI|nr:CYP27A1 [Symbiodinium pilosum]
MARRLLFLGLALQVPLLQAQTSEDVDFMRSSPLGCFVRGFKFDRYIPNKNINTTSLKLCQQHCQYVDGCVKFSYRAFWGECWFADINAVEVPVESPYLIVGYRTCDTQGMQRPARCSTETPGNGFPGQTAEASNAAWPGGKQPYSLECWPKSWDGAPLPCKEVSVLDDTKNGWPGKCVGLVEMKQVNGSNCGENCRQHPGCQSWQKTVYNSCWQGLGKDCFVRHNWMPKEAQRLQHGSVRVLKDLTGMQIVGLWKGFDNIEGFFQNAQDAIAFCKHMCYSDFRCQYWTYAPNYGCWIEDASQEYGPPFPLTLDAARRDTMFAADCVAGEYIQHFCPEGFVNRIELEQPANLSDCAEKGFRYEPPDMFLTHRTSADSWEQCRMRCKLTVYCHELSVAAPGADAPAKDQPGLPLVPQTAHMAEIQMPLHNLDVVSLSEPAAGIVFNAQCEKFTSFKHGASAEAGPGPNDLKAQVKLSPIAGGSILTAFTLNEPIESPDPTVLERKLKVPALASNMKAATSGAALPSYALSGPLLVGEPHVGTKDHPLKAPQQQPSFFSQWWPLLAVLGIVACIGGGIYIHRLSEMQSRDDKRVVLGGRRAVHDSSLQNHSTSFCYFGQTLARGAGLRAAGRGISAQDSDMSMSLKDRMHTAS